MNLHIPRRNEDESHDGPVEPPWDEDEPPPDDQAEDRTEAGYWSRYVTGAQFLLDKEPDPDPIWGDGPEVLWSPGEPCLVTGPVGVGKTTMVGRLTRGRLGLDPQLLGYKITPGQRRVLYLACDRPRQIRRNLARMMRPEDRSVLADRLLVWPGPPPTDLAKTPSFLLDMCRKADADTVVVDGLKDVALELSKDDVGAGLNQAFQRCVVEGIEVIGNHHQKKSSNGAAEAPQPRPTCTAPSGSPPGPAPSSWSGPMCPVRPSSRSPPSSRHRRASARSRCCTTSRPATWRSSTPSTSRPSCPGRWSPLAATASP